jgi:hypothetical protein
MKAVVVALDDGIFLQCTAMIRSFDGEKRALCKNNERNERDEEKSSSFSLLNPGAISRVATVDLASVRIVLPRRVSYIPYVPYYWKEGIVCMIRWFEERAWFESA